MQSYPVAFVRANVYYVSFFVLLAIVVWPLTPLLRVVSIGLVLYALLYTRHEWRVQRDAHIAALMASEAPLSDEERKSVLVGAGLRRRQPSSSTMTTSGPPPLLGDPSRH